MTDGEFGSKSNEEIKSIWKHRLKQSLDDWKKTIEWSSRISTQKHSSPKLQNKRQRWVKLKQHSINRRSFNSDSSVFGRLMKPKIDDAYGAYTGDKDRSDYTAEQDWRDLNAVWKSIPKKGATASLSSLKQSSLDMDEIIEGEDSDPDQGNTGRWFPNKGSWLESWQLKGEEVGKNVFTSVENDSDAVPDSLFSRGMSDGAEADVRRRYVLTIHSSKKIQLHSISMLLCTDQRRLSASEEGTPTIRK